MKWIRTKDVADKLALSLSGFKTLMDREPDFPKGVRVTDRHVVWDEEAVEKWMKNKLTSNLEVSNVQGN
jgi:predicted DNA-binding transcriptional regulator AlpA